MKIEKIPINGDTIARAITQNYFPPSGNINLNAIITNKWYNYLVLFEMSRILFYYSPILKFFFACNVLILFYELPHEIITQCP